MQKRNSIFLIAAFNILFSSFLFSQQYQPFRAGPQYTFQYQSDSLHFLQVDSLALSGNDSVFYFNTLAKKSYNALLSTVYSLGHDNIVLRKMVKKPAGQYVFLDSLGDSLRIETQWPLNSSWAFHMGSGVTAQIVNRGVQLVDGNMDSLLTVELSTGDSLLLSQNHGFLRLPDLRSFTGSVLNGAIFSLWRTPGNPISVTELFDYDPGDYFGYYHTITSYSPGYFEAWWRIEILSRTDFPAQDSVSYAIQREELNIDWYSGISTYIPLHPDTLFYSPPIYPDFGLPTLAHSEGNLLVAAVEEPTTGRIKLTFSAYYFNPYTHTLDEIIDGANVKEYKSGFGNFFESYSGITDREIVIECYRKASDSMMPCQPFGSLVGQEPKLHSSQWKAFPNPAASSLTIATDYPITHPLPYLLHSVIGNKVLEGIIRLEKQEISLEGIPEGLYLLSIGKQNPIIRKIQIRR